MHYLVIISNALHVMSSFSCAPVQIPTSNFKTKALPGSMILSTILKTLIGGVQSGLAVLGVNGSSLLKV